MALFQEKKTIWKIAPSSPAKPIVGIELKYIMNF